MRPILIGHNVTGQTPFFSSMVKPGIRADMYFDEGSMGCIDAPLYIPTGHVRNVKGWAGIIVGQDLSQIREGTH